MSEPKKYDNSNKIAVWMNGDGTLSISGNLFGNDFKIKGFLNEKYTPENKQPKWRASLKDKLAPTPLAQREDIEF